MFKTFNENFSFIHFPSLIVRLSVPQGLYDIQSSSKKCTSIPSRDAYASMTERCIYNQACRHTKGCAVY